MVAVKKIKSFLRVDDFPCYRQLDANDCGPSCIRMICSYYDKKYSLKTVKKACNTTRLGSTIHDLLTAAKGFGFHAAAVKLSRSEIERMPLPSILYWKQSHFVVLYRIFRKNEKCLFHIVDPAFGKIIVVEEVFLNSFMGDENSGVAIILDPTDTFYEKEEEKYSFYDEIKDLMVMMKSTISTYRTNFIIALVLSVLAMLANWVMPVLFQRIIDDGIGQKSLDIIKVLSMSQFVLFLGYIISNNFSNIILSKIGYRLGIGFLSSYLHKLIRLPISFFDTKANSDLIQLVDDQENMKSFLIYNLIKTFFSLSNLLVFSGILIYFNYRVFIAFLLFGVLSGIWSSLFFNKQKVVDYMKFAASSEGKNNIYELIMGMREIKINSAQENKVVQVEKTQNKINQYHLKNLYIQYYSSLGISALNKLKDIVIVVFCAHLVIAGQMTLGVLMTISYLLGQLSEPFNQILEFTRQFQKAKLSFDRLSEIQKVTDEDSVMKIILPDEICRGISLVNASFRYPGSYNRYVLRDINVQILKNKVTAIVGASGSGKTTLLKLLLSFYYPQEGHVYLDDNKMLNINADEWRKKCGVVMQDGFMFSGSIMDNIAIADEKPDMDRVQTAAQIACIDDFIESLPMKYNTKIGNTGIDLSGGQKQRLLIARAVYKDPEFIFFDEATSFLDTTNEARIMQNLKSFYRGKTVVIIAHRLSTVKDADNIIVLDNGCVVENGTHNQLTRRRGMYYTLIKNQLELNS